MKIKGLDWIANGLGLIGTILMANKFMVSGWGVLFAANVTFIVYGFVTKQRSFIGYNIIFASNSMYGFYRWL